MTPAAVALLFALCGAGGRNCEEGTVIARDCAAAEAWIRAGMRSHQTLHVLQCEPYDGRWPGGD